MDTTAASIMSLLSTEASNMTLLELSTLDFLDLDLNETVADVINMAAGCGNVTCGTGGQFYNSSCKC